MFIQGTDLILYLVPYRQGPLMLQSRHFSPHCTKRHTAKTFPPSSAQSTTTGEAGRRADRSVDQSRCGVILTQWHTAWSTAILCHLNCPQEPLGSIRPHWSKSVHHYITSFLRSPIPASALPIGFQFRVESISGRSHARLWQAVK
jgi:hypothetical protein